MATVVHYSLDVLSVIFLTKVVRHFLFCAPEHGQRVSLLLSVRVPSLLLVSHLCAHHEMRHWLDVWAHVTKSYLTNFILAF